jgi:hypothetical protein
VKVLGKKSVDRREIYDIDFDHLEAKKGGHRIEEGYAIVVMSCSTIRLVESPNFLSLRVLDRINKC